MKENVFRMVKKIKKESSLSPMGDKMGCCKVESIINIDERGQMVLPKELIKSAGFQNVRVIDETVFPIELIANDPTAEGIMDNLGIGLDEARGVASSVVSIKVSAIKPLVGYKNT